MKIVHVIFKNPEYNYSTSINPNSTDTEIKGYFVGSIFNVGVYPKENLQTCTNVIIETN